MDSRRLTDVLFIASVLVWSGAVGWHYTARVRLPDEGGSGAFMRQLFDDSAMRRRRWTIMSPAMFTHGKYVEAGELTMTVSATGPDEREMVSELRVRRGFSIRGRTRSIWRRNGDLVSFNGEGSIGSQRFGFDAIREGDLLVIKITRDGHIIHERFVEEQDLPAGFSPFLPMKGLQVGDSWKVASVNAFDGTVTRDRIVVDREEVYEHHGKPVPAKVVICEGRDGVQAWYGEDGEVLRADVKYLVIRLRLILQPRDISTMPARGGGGGGGGGEEAAE